MRNNKLDLNEKELEVVRISERLGLLNRYLNRFDEFYITEEQLKESQGILSFRNYKKGNINANLGDGELDLTTIEIKDVLEYLGKKSMEELKLRIE